MKKKKLKSLSLNKKTISGFQSTEVIGGLGSAGICDGKTNFDHTCIHGPGACGGPTNTENQTASICVPSFTCTLACP